MSELAVLTEGLVCNFNEVRAVDSLDLSVSKGEIYGFLGPNGAGKSTTLRMLTTLLVPTAGRATVLGMDVVNSARDIRLHIGRGKVAVGREPVQKAPGNDGHVRLNMIQVAEPNDVGRKRPEVVSSNPQGRPQQQDVDRFFCGFDHDFRG